MIQARTILHSISPSGIELYTVEVHYPRFIHEELMTHRVFSRNASSTRAVPTSKLIAEARNASLRAKPVVWGRLGRGMQSSPEEDPQKIAFYDLQWQLAAEDAARRAEIMVAEGCDKQTVNRILMPFIHIHVLITATDWMNFFGLRLDKGADPTMRALAVEIWKAYKSSRPTLLRPKEWHCPYVGHIFLQDLRGLDEAVKNSVAFSCRVSYESFETGRRATWEENISLYNRIAAQVPMHASPCEHQATPDIKTSNPYGIPDGVRWQRPGLHGNLRGWIQYRKTLPGEACAPLPPDYQTL